MLGVEYEIMTQINTCPPSQLFFLLYDLTLAQESEKKKRRFLLAPHGQLHSTSPNYSYSKKHLHKKDHIFI